MLIVSDDRAVVEADLAAGRLVCPRCRAGVLGGWGCSRLREVRTSVGSRRLRPRRGRCRERSCGATHMLLPEVCLARRRRSPAHPTGSPAPRSAISANATSPPTASSKHSPRSPPPAAPNGNAPTPPAAPPNAGPPRQHPAPGPRPLRASGSHRSPSGLDHQHAPANLARPRSERSPAKAKRSQRVTHNHTPPSRPPSMPPFPTPPATPSVVRSFASPIPILDGAVIAILRVRQQPPAASAPGGRPAPRGRSCGSPARPGPPARCARCAQTRDTRPSCRSWSASPSSADTSCLQTNRLP